MANILEKGIPTTSDRIKSDVDIGLKVSIPLQISGSTGRKSGSCRPWNKVWYQLELLL
jgi:hypothetical protein